MPRRTAMSLLEVILAIAILGGALATIGQLLRIGSRNAAMARDLTLAQIYCETKANEILVGTLLPEAISDAALDETSAKGEWLYKIDTVGTETPGVINVTVTVGQNPSVVARPVSHSVSRLMIEPQTAADLATQEQTVKQAFADAKTLADGPMSGTIVYSPPVPGGMAGGTAGGGGGGGGNAGGGNGGRNGGNNGGPNGNGGNGGGPNGGNGNGNNGQNGGRDRGGRGDDGGRRGGGNDDGGRRGGGQDDGGRRGGGDNQDNPQRRRFGGPGPNGPGPNNPSPNGRGPNGPGPNGPGPNGPGPRGR